MFFLIFLIPLHAETILELDDLKIEKPLGKYISVLEDTKGSLSINDIILKKYSNQFKSFAEDDPSLGFTRSTFWIKLTIHNLTDESLWVLDQSYANTQYLDLYTPEENGKRFSVKYAGNLRTSDKRDISHRRSIFNLSIKTGEQKTYYLRYQNQGSSNLEFKISTARVFANADRIESFWMGLFYGLLVLILLMNLILYFFFRKPSYRYLAIFVISIGATFLFYDGYGQMLFSESFIHTSQHFQPMAMAISMLSLLYFGQSLLVTSEKPKTILYALTFCWLVLLFLKPFLEYVFVMLTILPLLLITLSYLVAIGVSNWNKQTITAKLLIFGLSFFFISFTISLMVNFGNIETSFFAEQGFRFALLILLILMSMSIVEHIQQLQLSEKEITTALNLSRSELLESNEKFTKAFHSQPIPMQIFDLDSNMRIDVNDQFCQLFEFEREELLAAPALNLNLWRHPEQLQKAMKKLIAKTTVQNIPLEMYTNSGHILYALVSASILDINNRKLAIVTFIDITENKNIEQELILKEHEQSEILNSTIDGIITIDETGKVLTFNKSSEKLFGFTADEVVGLNISQLMPNETAHNHDAYLKRYVDTGVARVVGSGAEVYAQHKDKTIFPMRLSLAELSPDSSGKKRFVGSCQDLTQIKQQEEQLRRSQKMDALGKLTGGIAHDFNNLLGVILGYSDLLEKSLTEPKSTKYIRQIKQAGERGANLTNKLLRFSKKKSSVLEVVDLNTLLLNQRHLLEKVLTARISLLFELDETLYPVALDDGDLEDCILNFAINAMHAIADNGNFTIHTNNKTISSAEASILQLPAGKYAVLTISDTGCGMDKETVTKIFDPFFSTKGEKGTGLGLSQVYGFIESSGGAIKVYSEPGHGTQFTLYFPQSNKPIIETNISENNQQSPLTGSETILVVDDEPALRLLSEEILKQNGYQVFLAESSMEALVVLKTQPIHLMLTDVIMPNVDGYQLAAIVLEKYPKIKIQLMSGFTDNRYQLIHNENLHNQLLTKPFIAETLLIKIRTLLDNTSFNDS